MRTPRRVVPLVLVLAATTGLAACGGGGGGDEDAYVKTYQDTCTTLQASTKTLGTKLQTAATSAGGDQAKALAASKPVLVEFYDGLIDALDALGGADAPAKYAGYQEDVTEKSGKAKSALEDVRNGIRDARTAADLTKQGNALENLDIGDADAPAELKKAAPACAALGD